MKKGHKKKLILCLCAALLLSLSALTANAAELPCESPDDPEYYKYLKKLESTQSCEVVEYSAESAFMERYYLENVAPREESPVGAVDAASPFDVKSPFDGKIHRHNARFAEDYTLLNGVDVSYYNGNIDWNKYVAAGVKFAIIRSSYTGYGSGVSYPDSKYQTYIPAAVKAGVPVGIYHYSQAININEAIAEANYVISLIAPYKNSITLPVVFDFEYAENSKGLTGRLYNAKLTKQQKTDLCLAFCQTIEKAGYKAMVYASMSMFRDEMYANQISDKYQIWLAHYTTETSYTGEYSFWQYGYGTVGQYTQIDCDFWYKPLDGKIEFSSSQITLTPSEEKSLEYTVKPADSNPVSFVSSAPDIISVNEKGVVKALKPGKAVITATIPNGKSAQCTVLCPLEIKLDKSFLQLINGKTAQLTALSLSGSECEGLFTSSDKSVASVADDGTVTALKTGRCEISFTADGGLTEAVCTVETGVDPVSISLPSSDSVPQDSSKALSLTYGNSAAKGSFTVSWTSSDDKIAKVSQSGMITGINKGTCRVTASCAGFTSSCDITVTNRLITVSMPISGAGSQIIRDLNGGSSSVGTKLTLTLLPAVGGSSITSASYAGGSASLTAPEGIYTLNISRPGFLSYTDQSFSLGSDLLPSVLLGGDIDGDDVIDIFDLSLLCEKCELFAAGIEYSSVCDLDSDGTVGEKDIDILIGNYARISTTVS